MKVFPSLCSYLSGLCVWSVEREQLSSGAEGDWAEWLKDGTKMRAEIAGK